MRFLLLFLLFIERPVQAESLRDQIHEWASLCQGAASKQNCDDGDALLFNGLLCSTGMNDFACEAVRNSQSSDGRVWRSPRRVLKDTKNSFSRDMSLGVLLYAVQSKDVAYFSRWRDYTNSIHRLCPDATDNRCQITPRMRRTYVMVEEFLKHAEVKEQLSDHYDLLISAGMNQPGYTLHLVGVHIYLRFLFGHNGETLQRAARSLYNRQPKNLFFAYLANANSDEVWHQFLDQDPGVMPARLHQWQFERSDEEQAWEESMGWDRIFLIDLIDRQL